MERGSWICATCAAQATSFCLCRGGDILLCDQCLMTHFAKNMGRAHSAHPVAAYQHREIPGYLEKLQKRCDCRPAAIEELRKSVTAVDRCIAELNEKAEAMVAALKDYARVHTEKLVEIKRKLQADIEQSIEEVESTLYEHEVKLHSKYGELLRSNEDENPCFEVFEYSVGVVEQFPESCICLGWCMDKNDEVVLPCITGNSVKWCNVETGESKTATLSVTFTNGTVFCLLNSDMVLCVGGSPPTSAVHLLNSATNAVSVQSPMRVNRDYCGVIKAKSFVYVFGGGCTSPISSCEKYSLSTNSWSPLSNMLSARACFTPCLHQSAIYLVSFRQPKNKLEAFTLATETFKDLPIELPASLGTGNSSVTFVSNQEMIIITGARQIGRIRLGIDTSARVSPFNTINLGSKINPIKVGRDVFWVDHERGSLVKFNLDSLIFP